MIKHNNNEKSVITHLQKGVPLDKRVTAIEVEQLRQQKDVTEITLAFHEATDLFGEDLELGNILIEVSDDSLAKVIDEETALALANMPAIDNRRDKIIPNIDTNTMLLGLDTEIAEPVLTGNYVIRFQFSKNTPVSEWNDETLGWREAGQGTRFRDAEYAKLRILQLKNKWPDYPIVLHELTSEA
ncbi:hypothetical protein [Beggiatoa leptomitoformis]|uniref:Uncharacterized protein n=1 Tax=Beggiatoa leptomitoformis TaxID=288004 RepID=A0A2N9YII9_9GAMM|nr:hypothetical protein [Beggiatoa leptomitoformis]ALG67592.1 hypothetical protein AL038_07620 [Beggiatoa leptomitoformis]AUI70175.1 hypothetical protein BLE401_16695 [Beggiatoa leptomitoformis]